ncbi:MAG: hypothetical protein LC437_06465 [Thiohalomonas sp.]|nr:hypothetical protein [Thiohalomonas sp.]
MIISKCSILHFQVDWVYTLLIGIYGYFLQNHDKQKGFICDFPAHSSYNDRIILNISS